ncbi:hypothetical protein ApDm4_0286 [Acetobacter pomorum]|nr:hypothetical protein ApDm4_0286 [Acetobacter pomorum]
MVFVFIRVAARFGYGCGVLSKYTNCAQDQELFHCGVSFSHKAPQPI